MNYLIILRLFLTTSIRGWGHSFALSEGGQRSSRLKQKELVFLHDRIFADRNLAVTSRMGIQNLISYKKLTVFLSTLKSF